MTLHKTHSIPLRLCNVGDFCYLCTGASGGPFPSGTPSVKKYGKQ